MNPLLNKVSNEDIELAIVQLKSKRPVRFIQYNKIKDEKTSKGFVTLPELYRELADRIEEGTAVIRQALSEFEDNDALLNSGDNMTEEQQYDVPENDMAPLNESGLCLHPTYTDRPKTPNSIQIERYCNHCNRKLSI